MAYDNILIQKILANNKAAGVNPQRLLDHPLFRELPLSAKASAIQENRAVLVEEPKFEWKEIPIGMAFGAAATGGANLMHQAATGMGRLGFSRLGMGTALGTGAVIGGILAAQRAHSSYRADKATQERIGDAIDALLSRTSSGQGGAAPRPDFYGRGLSAVERGPMVASQSLTNMDYQDKLRVLQEAQMAQAQAPGA